MKKYGERKGRKKMSKTLCVMKKWTMIFIFSLLAQNIFAFSITLKGSIEDALKTKDVATLEKEMNNHWNKRNNEKDKLKEAFNVSVDGHTPLYYAVKSGNFNLVYKMLEVGANPNESQGNDMLPILLDALWSEKADFKIIEALINKGADCNWSRSSVSRNFKNYTPLLLASWTEDTDIIKLILEKTSQYDVRCSFTNENGTYEYTPVEYLLFYYEPKFYDIVKDLIENKKCDISYFCRFGNYTDTPVLFNSVQKDKKLQKLVLNNIDIDKLQDIKITDEIESNGEKIKREGTVFSELCSFYNPKDYDCMQIIQKMLEKNIDVNATFKIGDDEEIFPLFSFVTKENPSQYEEIIKKLLEKGAAPNKEVVLGKAYRTTAMHYVAFIGDDKLLKLLKDFKGDLEKKDSDGKTPWDYWKGYWNGKNKNSADLLVDAYLFDKKMDDEFLSKLDLRVRTSVGNRTVLQVAIENNDRNTAIEILKKQLSIWREKDKNGKNALEYALDENHYQKAANVVDYIISEKHEKIGDSLFAVIDNALETGEMGILNEALANKNDDFSHIRTQHQSGNRTMNVSPIVFVAMKSNENKNKNKKRVLEILAENKQRFSKEGLNEKFSGNTPVLWNDDDESTKRILLECGADPSIKGTEEFNAIDFAFRKHQSVIIEWLLENDVKIGDAVFSAIDGELNGDVHLAEFLDKDKKKNFLSQKITKNENGIEIKCGVFTYALLTESTNGGNNINSRKLILDKLLERGADINETVTGGEYDGCTAIMMSAIKGDDEAVDYLLSHGADIEKSSSARKNAIFYALENQNRTGNDKIVDSLLKSVDYKIKDIRAANGETLLMCFSAYGKFEQFISLFSNMVEENPDIIERKDNNGMTPFLYAASYNHDYRIMKLLRMYGADVNAKDNNGRNAVVLAREFKNTTEDNNTIEKRLNSYGVYEK